MPLPALIAAAQGLRLKGFLDAARERARALNLKNPEDANSPPDCFLAGPAHGGMKHQ
jgi:hypothetical protein